MQSSTAVFLRAAVMLGVLVVLPTWALLGTSLPDKLLPLVSWEEAPQHTLPRQQRPSNPAIVRARDDGRRVLLTDRFAQLEQALREAGATHFTVSVENTSPSPSYWCSCQVVDRRERFEAVAANALGAMEEVLRQIHAWRCVAAPPR